LDSELDHARTFFEQVRKRPKGFTPQGRFTELCALVIGYDCGVGRGLLNGFQEWLGSRRGRPELAFWFHVWAATVADRPIRADLHLSTDEDAAATAQLFDWIEEYLNDASSR